MPSDEEPFSMLGDLRSLELWWSELGALSRVTMADRSIDFGSSFKDDISGWQLQSDSAGSNVFFQFSAGKSKKTWRGRQRSKRGEQRRDSS